MSARREDPPRLAVWLLAHFLPADVREGMLGDLEEVFRERVLPARGSARRGCGSGARLCLRRFHCDAIPRRHPCLEEMACC